jgi:hypothetical protein
VHAGDRSKEVRLRRFLSRRHDVGELLRDLILPELGDGAHLIEPLSIGGEALGFLVLEYRRHHTVSYEVMREQLSARIHLGRERRRSLAVQQERAGWLEQAERQRAEVARLERELSLRESDSATRLAAQLRQLIHLAARSLEELEGTLASADPGPNPATDFSTVRAQFHALRLAYEQIEAQLKREVPTERPRV